MGCGFRQLTWVDCDSLAWILQVLIFIALLSLAVLVGLLGVDNSGKRLRFVRYLALVAALLGGLWWWVRIEIREVREHDLEEARAIHDQFTATCYEHASEVIERVATNMRSLTISPPSDVRGDYGNELFFGHHPNKEWAGISTSLVAPSNLDGAYELRYTYIPQKPVVKGRKVLFHGVKQEVIDLARNRVIAERMNFLAGTYFHGGHFCLGSDWFDGNYGFAERVLGPRYIDSTKLLQVPQQYVKAKLTNVEDVAVQLRTFAKADELPAGAEVVYNDRMLHLPTGNFKMLTVSSEPIPIASTVEHGDQFVFMMFPEGGGRSWPLRKVLFNFRTKTGEDARRLFVQLPPSLDWTNGWGFDPKDFKISANQITFKLFGKKERAGEYSGSENHGQYGRRYTFTIDLPALP